MQDFACSKNCILQLGACLILFVSVSVSGIGPRCRCVTKEKRPFGRYVGAVEINPASSHCKDTEIMQVTRVILWIFPHKTLNHMSVSDVIDPAVLLSRGMGRRIVWTPMLHGSKCLKGERLSKCIFFNECA